MSLPYVFGKVFSVAQMKCFFFMAQITQILLFLGMLVLERSKITINSETFSKIFSAMEFLGMCLHHAFLNVFSVAPMKCFCL